MYRIRSTRCTNGWIARFKLEIRAEVRLLIVVKCFSTEKCVIIAHVFIDFLSFAKSVVWSTNVAEMPSDVLRGEDQNNLMQSHRIPKDPQPHKLSSRR